jgi:two-component system, NarL family, response regulator DevR
MPAAKRTAVLLDPHPLWLDAIAGVLGELGVDVVGRATHPEKALSLLETHRPDLFVAEIHVGDFHLDGITCLRRAREQVPHLKIIVLATSDDPAAMEAAFAAGASAYVIKRAQAEDLALTVRQTFDHSVFFTSPRVRSTAPAKEKVDPSWGLTRRELEIIRLVAEGHSNTDLAKMLWVTEKTVKFHLSNIYRKLGVSNRTQASRWAQLHGVLHTPDKSKV